MTLVTVVTPVTPKFIYESIFPIITFNNIVEFFADFNDTPANHAITAVSGSSDSKADLSFITGLENMVNDDTTIGGYFDGRKQYLYSRHGLARLQNRQKVIVEEKMQSTAGYFKKDASVLALKDKELKIKYKAEDYTIKITNDGKKKTVDNLNTLFDVPDLIEYNFANDDYLEIALKYFIKIPLLTEAYLCEYKTLITKVFEFEPSELGNDTLIGIDGKKIVFKEGFSDIGLKNVVIQIFDKDKVTPKPSKKTKTQKKSSKKKAEVIEVEEEKSEKKIPVAEEQHDFNTKYYDYYFDSIQSFMDSFMKKILGVNKKSLSKERLKIYENNKDALMLIFTRVYVYLMEKFYLNVLTDFDINLIPLYFTANGQTTLDTFSGASMFMTFVKKFITYYGLKPFKKSESVNKKINTKFVDEKVSKSHESLVSDFNQKLFKKEKRYNIGGSELVNTKEDYMIRQRSPDKNQLQLNKLYYKIDNNSANTLLTVIDDFYTFFTAKDFSIDSINKYDLTKAPEKFLTNINTSLNGVDAIYTLLYLYLPQKYITDNDVKKTYISALFYSFFSTCIKNISMNCYFNKNIYRTNDLIFTVKAYASGTIKKEDFLVSKSVVVTDNLVYFDAL